MENFLGDILKNMLKDAVIKEPRKLVPFKRKEGLLYQCIEKYVRLLMEKYEKDREQLEVKCSYITTKEEELFNNVLFNLFFDSEYVYETELYIILDDFSELIGMSVEEIHDILMGYTQINVKIKGKDENDIFIASSLFPESESGNCYNFETDEYDSKERYFKLNINAEFLKACSEVRSKIQ